MKKYFEILKFNPIFSEIEENEFASILSCLNSSAKKYTKNETIIMAGDFISKIGVLISGSANIIKNDLEGNQLIVSELAQNDIFAESIVCAGIGASPVTVIATSNCEVLFLDYAKVINVCSNSCTFHSKLISNLISIIANKNLLLNQKIDILSKRSIREKTLHFLKLYAKGENKLTINLNREQLANYLCVDRSALSAELSRMQKDKIISFKKNQFELL